MTMDYSYVADFKKLGFGLFNHFGLYSVLGKGEWFYYTNQVGPEKARVSESYYRNLINQFVIDPDWAEKLAQSAKKAGCRYITLTTRHHEGFSLYDTKGLSTFDAPHSASHRDLVKEFVDACHKYDLMPVFYHTVIDWFNPDAKAGRYDRYFDYLQKSIEVLCSNYGEIGGIWFDGTWGLPKGVEFPREIYQTIHQLQPRAIVTNNTGLDALGQQGAEELDCVTFERGKPFPIVNAKRPIAGEVCEGISDHWGYAKEDLCVKSFKELLNLLIDCRSNGCNLLLNAGLTEKGLLSPSELPVLYALGRWLEVNHNIILDAEVSPIQAQNAVIFEQGEDYYAVIKDVPMCTNSNVTRMAETKRVIVKSDKKIVNATWFDNGETVKMDPDGSFVAWPFDYGYSYGARIAHFNLKSV
jgi:alpha-L-fucosidase